MYSEYNETSKNELTKRKLRKIQESSRKIKTKQNIA